MLMESMRSENSGCVTNMMSTTHSTPSTKTTENKPTPPENDLTSQTSYMEFLAIMKDYTNSNCDAKELVQRMHSLLQQNDHLSNVLISNLSVTKTERHTTKTSPRSCGSQKGTLHSSEITKIAPSNVTAQPPKSNTKVCNTRSQEQVWLELQLQVDHSLDVLDLTLSAHDTPTPRFPSISNYRKYHVLEVDVPCAPTPSSSLRSIPPTTSPFSDQSKSLRPSKCPRQPPIDSFSFESDSAASDQIDGSILAPMDEDDTSLNGWSPKVAECPIQAPWNASITSKDTSDPLESLHRPLETNPKDPSWHQECDYESMWGAVEEHPPDLLSCIDHSLLCDRENRFRLDWDVRNRPEARQKRRKRVLHGSNSRFSSESDSESVCRSDRKNGLSAELTPSASPTSPSRAIYHTIDRFVPPEHRPSQCKMQEESMENWDSMDFGTFQNRRVSRILSSCWNRRKLFGPYKNRIKLVNIDVPGRNLAAAAASRGTLGGSLASSLIFGTQAQANVENVNGNVVPMLSGIGMTGNASYATNPTLKNEKKLKRREERKRNMTLKMQETLSELDTTFTEQDLDVKGLSSVFANTLGGASISKLALSKLETLPLPESSNLPQDLKELKRKIEATEVKVEGTKHRHRKGGPCPRCQVQNQLRAARRAYHKRAVAHKKLPQIAATIEALTQAAACSSDKPNHETKTEPIRLLDPKKAMSVVPFGSMHTLENANLVVSVGPKTQEQEPRLNKSFSDMKACGLRPFCKTSTYPSTDGRSAPSSPNAPAPMHLTVSSA
uniref:Uncharacterized protein AlNc14C368G11071 n=1 Tax=Albugo laibachii Nc14 TaxID=890382 RepID=F0WY25_9STRA|nr:conserved hypothetical protein [Albugo laibachii Nc14]|eukprot:CCA26374.1 conserved hypothetical protein [Albugo laibachii Nc14]